MSVDYAYEIATAWTPQEVAQLIAERLRLTIELRRNHYVLFNDDVILWVEEQPDIGRGITNENPALDTTVNVMGNPFAVGREYPGMQVIGRVGALLIEEHVGDFTFLENGESARLLRDEGEIVVHDGEWWVSFWTPILGGINRPFTVEPLPLLSRRRRLEFHRSHILPIERGGDALAR